MAKIDEIKMLRLGQRDENLARSLTFDCSDWLEQYPEASIHILFRRPGESAIVPMSTTLEGTTLTWLIHDFEVGKTGIGNAEFRAVDTAGLRRKSRIIPCSIEETLLGDDETVLYTQDQVDETLAHISEAAQAARAAKASEEAAALSAQEAGESAASAGTAADVAVSAKDAAQAAQTAAETAQHQAEAAQSGVHADAVAAEQAKVAAQAAQASAQGSASQASADRTAAESARADAEAAATHAETVVEGIDQAGADQVAAVNAAGQAQVTAVNQAGTTQVGNVNAVGTTQVNAVQAKGTQVINSIPADYSTLSSDVTDLKSAVTDVYIPSENLHNPATDRHGIYIDGNGVITENSSYKATDYIYVGAGGKVTIDVINGISRFFYYTTNDASGFSRALWKTNEGAKTLELSSTEQYIVILMTEACPDYMVNLGTTLLPYVPYGGAAGAFLDGVIDGIHSEIATSAESVRNTLNRLGYSFGSFQHINGTTHSSQQDRVYIAITSGETYYITLSLSITGVSNSYFELFVYDAEGTGTSLGNPATQGERLKFTATQNIASIGIFVRAVVSNCTVSTLVEKENSIFIDTERIDPVYDAIFPAHTALSSSMFTQGTLYNGTLVPDNTKCISTKDFIPVGAYNLGKIYFVDDDPNGDWKTRITFFDASRNFLSYIGYGYYTEFQIPANAVYYKLSLSYYVNDTNVDTSPSTLASNVVHCYVDATSIQNLHDLIDTKITKPLPEGITTYAYSGEPIDIKTNKIAYLSYMTAASQSSNTRQGCAVYNNLLFLAHNTLDKIAIFDIETKNHVQNITMSSVSTYHCNNLNFGTEKYSSSDAFPLLYISMENAAEHKCCVYRITVSDNVYAATLVQTITYPAPIAMTAYYPNCILDNSNGVFYIMGYTEDGYTATPTNKLHIIAFDMPGISDGDVQLDYADKISEFVVESMSATQGAIINNNKIIQVYGQTNNYLGQIDLIKQAFVTKIRLDNIGITAEPESVFIWNGNLYIMDVNGKIYECYFG